METKTYQYLLIGGGLAGARAAQGIREIDSDGSMLMVCREPRLPYHRPPLTKGLLLGKKKPDEIDCQPAEFYRAKKVTTRTGVSAERLDIKARLVTLSNGTEVRFEKMLLATGCHARTLDVPGAALPGVLTVRTLDDSLKLLEAAKSAHNAVVVGGSYIGAEVASALAQLGVKVTMIFLEKRLLERVVDEELGRHLKSLFERHGIAFLPGESPARFEGNGKVRTVVTAKGAEIPADLVVVGVGATLNDRLAQEAGLASGERGGVKVDETLKTSVDGIYAAGDIADYPDPTYRKRLRVEHWDTAFRQGYTAGRNMAGAGETYSALPHYFTTLFNCGFSVWGDFSHWDSTLRRGDLGRTGTWIFYLDGLELRGILAFDPVEKEDEAKIEALVRRRVSASEVRNLAGL